MSEQQNIEFLSSRREILFLYDIRMGNPNGDPDENRPRRLPDGRFYVTDVRLKRFARDYVIATEGEDKILVGNIEGRTTNLTGRVSHYLEKIKKPRTDGQGLVDIILGAFIDARWFGSSLAFKPQKEDKKDETWKPQPVPKTLTGAVQFNMGEVLHDAEEIQIQGTSVFASDEDKTQGTFTDYAALRYGLIAFHGIANEHSAKKSRMTDPDYDKLLKALWNGVRSCGNTRTKVGQVPRLLISVEYKTGEEFQFGNLMDYVETEAIGGKPKKEWASPADYKLDITPLLKRFQGQAERIERIRYEVSPDMAFEEGSNIPGPWKKLGFDSPCPK